MPYSLRFVALLIVVGALCAPVSLIVQHRQSDRQKRATAVALTGGDVDRGRKVAERFGCGACHQISGVSGAAGQVGPPLQALEKRTEIAGKLSNDPASMILWIQHPQRVQPGVGMPELGLSDGEARDVAAYVYTL